MKLQLLSSVLLAPLAIFPASLMATVIPNAGKDSVQVRISISQSDIPDVFRKWFPSKTFFLLAISTSSTPSSKNDHQTQSEQIKVSNRMRVNQARFCTGVTGDSPPGGSCGSWQDCARCEPGFWRCCFAGCNGHKVPGSDTCNCIPDGSNVGPTCGCN